MVLLQRLTRLVLVSQSGSTEGVGTATAAAAALTARELLDTPPEPRSWIPRVPSLPPVLRRPLRAIVRTLWFESIAMSVVVANSIVLSLDHYNMSDSEQVRWLRPQADRARLYFISPLPFFCRRRCVLAITS